MFLIESDSCSSHPSIPIDLKSLCFLINIWASSLVSYILRGFSLFCIPTAFIYSCYRYPYFVLAMEQPMKYSSKLMNSIWGLYNRYSVHNFKKNTDAAFMGVGEHQL